MNIRAFEEADATGMFHLKSLPLECHDIQA